METVYNNNSKTGGTYKITNRTNGKAYYGSAKCFQVRASQHNRELLKGKHGNKHLQSAFNLTPDAFVFEVIQVIEGTKQDRLDAEQKLLDQFWDGCVNCYNIEKTAWSREGKKSKNPSPNRGCKILLTDGQKRKRSENSKLRWTSQEAHERHSVLMKNNWTNEGFRTRVKRLSGDSHPMYGKHMKEDSKQRMVATRNKRKSGMWGKIQSPESNEKRRQSKSKPVIQLTLDGQTIIAKFFGTKEASRVTGVCHSAIVNCCNEKRNSAGWYLWKYQIQ